MPPMWMGPPHGASEPPGGTHTAAGAASVPVPAPAPVRLSDHGNADPPTRRPADAPRGPRLLVSRAGPGGRARGVHLRPCRSPAAVDRPHPRGRNRRAGRRPRSGDRGVLVTRRPLDRLHLGARRERAHTGPGGAPGRHRTPGARRRRTGQFRPPRELDQGRRRPHGHRRPALPGRNGAQWWSRGAPPGTAGRGRRLPGTVRRRRTGWVRPGSAEHAAPRPVGRPRLERARRHRAGRRARRPRTHGRRRRSVPPSRHAHEVGTRIAPLERGSLFAALSGSRRRPGVWELDEASVPSRTGWTARDEDAVPPGRPPVHPTPCAARPATAWCSAAGTTGRPARTPPGRPRA